jgi:adenylyl cyclase-associated protein
VATSNTIGSGVEILGEIVNDGFAEMRRIVDIASKSKKPSDADLRTLLAGCSEIVARANKAKGNRKVPRDEGATVAEAMPCVAWLQISPAPCPYLQDGPIDGHAFWANKVRTANKNRDGGENHITWCNQIKELLTALKAYVKEHHLTGLTWNFKGGNALEAEATPAAAAPAAEESKAEPAAAAAPRADAKGALFAQLGAIDQSSGKTAGLRKVTKDMKSKNNTAPAVAPRPKAAVKPAKKWGANSGAAAVAKPPVKAQQGMKWAIEHQTGMVTLEADEVNPRQTVYIYGCKGATIQVQGKVNSIVVDTCSRTKVLFTDVIAAIEIVNSQRMQVQVRGKCPSVAIDKVDGILVYLSAESIADTVFTTSKSSEMNVSFPVEGSDDYVEKPIPEQFVHRVVDRSVTSDVSDLYSTG